jgi:hypothetical protein
VSIVFLRRFGKARASRRNCQYAKQIGVANPIASVEHYPNMRGEIAVKGAVPKQSVRDLAEGRLGPHGTTSLDEKVAQLHDLIRIAVGHICKLQRL